jgi:hypothetical protein
MLNVRYCLVHRQSPIYRDTDSTLRIHFTGVDVNVDQETMTRLIFYVQALLKEAKSEKSRLSSSVSEEADGVPSQDLG